MGSRSQLQAAGLIPYSSTGPEGSQVCRHKFEPSVTALASCPGGTQDSRDNHAGGQKLDGIPCVFNEYSAARVWGWQTSESFLGLKHSLGSKTSEVS